MATKSTKSEMPNKGQKVMAALLKPIDSTKKPQIVEPIKQPRQYELCHIAVKWEIIKMLIF